MDRIDKVFARWDRWAERNSKVLGVVCVLLVLLVSLVTYRFIGNLLEASLAVAFLPLVFIMGTALVGFIVAPAIVFIDLFAEKLGRYAIEDRAILLIEDIELLVYGDNCSSQNLRH